MKKSIFYILPVALVSCSEPTHPDATAICDCYNLLHHTRDEELVEIVADSCNQLYVETLEKLDKNKDELGEFRKAYDVCR